MTNDFDFSTSWMQSDSSANQKERFSEIKTYAYIAFDQLDLDGNGFIDETELLTALESPKTSEREKSFITFLLNNRQQIADSFDEGFGDPSGISRKDLEEYFKVITQLM